MEWIYRHFAIGLEPTADVQRPSMWQRVAVFPNRAFLQVTTSHEFDRKITTCDDVTWPAQALLICWLKVRLWESIRSRRRFDSSVAPECHGPSQRLTQLAVASSAAEASCELRRNNREGSDSRGCRRRRGSRWYSIHSRRPDHNRPRARPCARASPVGSANPSNPSKSNRVSPPHFAAELAIIQSRAIAARGLGGGGHHGEEAVLCGVVPSRNLCSFRRACGRNRYSHGLNFCGKSMSALVGVRVELMDSDCDGSEICDDVMKVGVVDASNDRHPLQIVEAQRS